MMRASAVAVLLLTASGCGRYADFTLPPLTGGDPNLAYTFEAQAKPVLSYGSGWESHDALNPSVIANPWVSGTLLNLYSAYDGHTWHTGVASSRDGIDWNKAGKILSPDPQTWEGSYIAANGSALSHGGEVWYWYVAGAEERPQLGLARSQAMGSWRKEPKPVLEPGPYESWDERGVADPYVVRVEPYFYLYYLGQDRARRQRLGVARSTDGIRWEKLRANPVLELGEPGAFDESGLGEPAVWNANGWYWMLYTGLNPKNSRKLGLARSSDGIHWDKLPVSFSGTEPWDSAVICDPTVIVEGSTVRVWFGGGDIASRDANLHGQIGIATLRPAPVTAR